jgi:hypothetical protein
MRFVLQKHTYHADILKMATGLAVARVYITLDEVRPHPVCDSEGRFIFAVRRVEDALPAFEKYCKDNQPPWQPVYTTLAQEGLPQLFIKRTPLGELRVQRDWNGNWFVLRDGQPLRFKGNVATFRCCDDAQRIADRHLCDLPKRSTNADGYSWPDPEEERELDRKIRQLLPR